MIIFWQRLLNRQYRQPNRDMALLCRENIFKKFPFGQGFMQKQSISWKGIKYFGPCFVNHI